MNPSNIESRDQEQIERRDDEQIEAKPERPVQAALKIKSGIRAGTVDPNYQPI